MSAQMEKQDQWQEWELAARVKASKRGSWSTEAKDLARMKRMTILQRMRMNLRTHMARSNSATTMIQIQMPIFSTKIQQKHSGRLQHSVTTQFQHSPHKTTQTKLTHPHCLTHTCAFTKHVQGLESMHFLFANPVKHYHASGSPLKQDK